MGRPSTLRRPELLDPPSARTPLGFDDVTCALDAGHIAATDAATALSKACQRLCSGECGDAAEQLASAVEALREALAEAEKCAAPMLRWMDRQEDY